MKRPPVTRAKTGPVWHRALLWALIAIVGAAGFAFWQFAGSRPVASSGTELGTLPRDVSRQSLNVVLVTLDTTRADRIGAYGAKDVETPVLDGIARDGVIFEQAVSAAPLTLPAHSSIFTGKFPPAHGVRDNGGFFFHESEKTIAERLQARGVTNRGGGGAPALARKRGGGPGGPTPLPNTSP